MALKSLNSEGGFGLANSTVIIDSNGNISATNLTVSSTSNLGSNSNVIITGGTNGQILSTNGSGNLSWISISTSSISNGTSNVNIGSANGNITFSVNNTANVVTIKNNGVSINGNLDTSGAISSNTSLTANNGYLYLENGVIAVGSGTAGIFNVGIGNVNLGLAAGNITLGSTTGNTVARGTLSANNLSTSGNLTVTNTATITNIKVSDLYSNRTPVAVTIDTIIDQFSVNKYRSAKYTMRVNSDDGYQAVEVLLIHDSINSYVTVYGSLSTTGSDIVVFSTDISGGNVLLKGTTSSTNTTVNLLGTYVAD